MGLGTRWGALYEALRERKCHIFVTLKRSGEKEEKREARARERDENREVD